MDRSLYCYPDARSLALVVCLVLMTAQPASADAIGEVRAVDQLAEVFRGDPAGAWTPEEIESAYPAGFEGLEGPLVQGSGRYGDVVWLRLQLVGPIEGVLEIDNVRIDEVSIWLRTEREWEGPYQAGEDTPLWARLVKHSKPRVPIRLDPGQQTTVYLRLFDEGTLVAPLMLGPEPLLQATWERRMLVNGSLALLMFWVILCTVILALLERRRLLGWLATAFAGFLVVHLFYFWGVGGELFPAAFRGPLVNRLNAASAVVVYPSLAAFTGDALSLRTHLPRLARLTWIASAILVVNSTFIVFGTYSNHLMVNHIGGMTLLLLLGVAAALRGAAGDKGARILLAAYGTYAITGTLIAVQTMGSSTVAMDAVFAASSLTFVTLLLGAVYRLAREIRLQAQAALDEKLAVAVQHAALSATFERFVPKEFLQQLEASTIDTIEVGQAVERPMAVLFADLRGFTRLAEGRPPRETFQLINDYLGQMEPIVRAHGGFVDKYIGDGVMALLPGGRSTDDAIAAGVAMFRALEDLNERRRAARRAPLEMGVGIDVGLLTLGTVGGPERINATAIGDAVNAAARIEAATKQYNTRLLVSQDVLERATRARWRVRLIDDEPVLPGKSTVVTLYEVLDALPKAEADARAEHLAEWSAAWDAYARGHFDEATRTLSTILAEVPSDGPALAFARRCQEQAGPGSLPDFSKLRPKS